MVGKRWYVAASLVTAAAALLVLLVPLSAHEVAGRPVEYRSLLVSEGPGLALVLALPVLVCAIPLLVPGRFRRAAAWAGAGVLAAGAVTALLSVGVFFLPGLILLVVAALRDRGGAAPARERATARRTRGS